MKVYDNAGHELTLSEPALGGGAEGKVYAIKGYSKVAKLYLDNPESHREKIEAMVSAYPSISKVPELKNVAWPMAALYADKSCTKFVGFGMKEVKGGDHLSKVYAYNPGLSSGYSNSPKKYPRFIASAMSLETSTITISLCFRVAMPHSLTWTLFTSTSIAVHLSAKCACRDMWLPS